MNDTVVNAFFKLGKEINVFLNEPEAVNEFHNALNKAIEKSYYENGWFTKDNIHLALAGIAMWLEENTVSTFISAYQNPKAIKRVGLILAGNIPMVGFHDLFLTILTGHHAVIKLSSSDRQLIPCLMNRLIEIEPELKTSFSYVERLVEFDAVIATGSNNSARYFEQYFSKKPHIIRRNRNSIAVIRGDETEKQLIDFGKDIFTYFGLGCRNVSKVLLPAAYDLNKLFAAFLNYNYVADNKKYINNYDYYKALYMLNKADLLENGFFMMKEDASLYSPVSMLFYQFYQSPDDLTNALSLEEKNIQCIVSDDTSLKSAIPFGKTQSPAIDDFADGVDTMAFLTSL